MSTEASNDAEHDNHQNPTIPFVLVNDFVTKQSDEEGNDSDKNDADRQRAFAVRYRQNNLTTNDRVDHTPSET